MTKPSPAFPKRRQGRPTVMTEAKVAAAKAAAAEGLSLTAIARRIGVPKNTFTKWFRDHPSPAPGRGRNSGYSIPRPPRTYTPEMVERIREAAAAGMYIAQAARHLGLTGPSLANWNRKHRAWPAPSRAASNKAWRAAHPEQAARQIETARASKRQEEADRAAANAATLARWRAQYKVAAE